MELSNLTNVIKINLLNIIDYDYNAICDDFDDVEILKY